MTDHELDAALGELGLGPSGSFHGEVMSRIEELDALREQYRRQTRTSRGIWLGGLCTGLIGVSAALLGPRLPGFDLGVALTAISAAECQYWVSAVAVAVAAALVAFDDLDGESSRNARNRPRQQATARD